MDHIFNILLPGMKYLCQHLFCGLKLQLFCIDLPGHLRVCFSSHESHVNTSNVACDPAIFISAFDLALEGDFGDFGIS